MKVIITSTIHNYRYISINTIVPEHIRNLVNEISKSIKKKLW